MIDIWTHAVLEVAGELPDVDVEFYPVTACRRKRRSDDRIGDVENRSHTRIYPHGIRRGGNADYLRTTVIRIDGDRAICVDSNRCITHVHDRYLGLSRTGNRILLQGYIGDRDRFDGKGIAFIIHRLTSERLKANRLGFYGVSGICARQVKKTPMLLVWYRTHR